MKRPYDMICTHHFFTTSRQMIELPRTHQHILRLSYLETLTHPFCAALAPLVPRSYYYNRRTRVPRWTLPPTATYVPNHGQPAGYRIFALATPAVSLNNNNNGATTTTSGSRRTDECVSDASRGRVDPFVSLGGAGGSRSAKTDPCKAEAEKELESARRGPSVPKREPSSAVALTDPSTCTGER